MTSLKTNSLLSRVIFSLVVFGVIALQPGCAIFNSDNRPVFSKFEETCVPESDGWMLATFPVTLPVGLIALTIDQFIVRPIQIADDTYKDVKIICWSNMEWDKHYVDQCFYFPWRVIATVIVGPLDYITRLFFDVPDHDTLNGEMNQQMAMDQDELQEQTPEQLRQRREHLVGKLEKSKADVEDGKVDIEQAKERLLELQAKQKEREEKLRAFDEEHPSLAPEVNEPVM